MEIELNDQERRALGRLLTERKALLIETTEDTTQPDTARRAGSIELSVIESILGKLRLRDVTSTGAANPLPSRSTRRSTHKIHPVSYPLFWRWRWTLTPAGFFPKGAHQGPQRHHLACDAILTCAMGGPPLLQLDPSHLGRIVQMAAKDRRLAGNSRLGDDGGVTWLPVAASAPTSWRSGPSTSLNDANIWASSGRRAVAGALADIKESKREKAIIWSFLHNTLSEVNFPAPGLCS